jgi:hypothetical protein
VANGAAEQLNAVQKFREAIWEIWPCPAFTLIPITPERLDEKKATVDFFFATILNEGVQLAA